MDYWHIGLYSISQSGSTTFDEINRTATLQFILSASQANGNSLTEFVDVNTETRPDLEGRDTYTVISKSNTDAVIYVVKNKVT
jgi:hypothetical protein